MLRGTSNLVSVNKKGWLNTSKLFLILLEYCNGRANRKSIPIVIPNKKTNSTTELAKRTLRLLF